MKHKGIAEQIGRMMREGLILISRPLRGLRRAY